MVRMKETGLEKGDCGGFVERKCSEEVKGGERSWLVDLREVE